MAAPDGRAELQLPAGTHLVHIGPHKTGSTSLQNAMLAARDAMRSQGVDLIGSRGNEIAGAGHAIGRRMPHHSPQHGERRWNAIVRAMGAVPADRRAVISSEIFSDAFRAGMQRVVRELGPRTHVAITLRPLAALLSSQWQQYVQRGHTVSYEDWLAAVLKGSRGKVPTPSFWRRHQHDALVRRWAEAVGPQNLTVVVVDSADHSFLPHAFEDLLGLRRDTLRLLSDRTNRSLTFHEAETLREFNRQFFAEGLTRSVHVRLLRQGAGYHLKQRAARPGEEPILTPQWAVDRASQLAAKMIDPIAESGVRVVGDLNALAAPIEKVGDQPVADAVSPDIAGRLAVGLVQAGEKHAARAAERTARRLKPSTVEAASSRALVAELRARLRAKVRRRAGGRA